MVDNFIIKKQLISKAVITIPYKKTTMAHCKSSISLGWRFLNFCSQNNSLYILGAGASLPEIRVDSNGIKDEISLLNSYDTNLHPRTAFRDRLGLTAFDLYQNKEQEIVQSLYDHTNEGTIEAIFSKQLISPLKETPVQYKVFDYFYPSTLFIFNNDNMHNFVHKRHTILHPHGTINSKFIESEIINECIKNGDVSQNLNRFNRFYKPVPEEKYITSGVPYRTLKHYFNDFKAIIFIGYSFGLQKKDNTIDDQESFEFLMSLIRQACRGYK